MEDTDASWGHLVAVMFQIVSILALKMPTFLPYVNDLALMPKEYLSVSELEDASVHTGESGERLSHMSGIGEGRPGSVPFVSH